MSLYAKKEIKNYWSMGGRLRQAQPFSGAIPGSSSEGRLWQCLGDHIMVQGFEWGIWKNKASVLNFVLSGLLVLLAILWFVFGLQQVYSGITLGSAFRNLWQCSGESYGKPRIEPWSAICRATALLAILSLQPPESCFCL